MVLDFQGVKKLLAITIVLHLTGTVILAAVFPTILMEILVWGILDDVIWLVRLRYPYTIASRPLIYVQILVTISNFLYTSYIFGITGAILFSLCLDNNITEACDSIAIGIMSYLIIADILLLCMVYFFFRILQFALQIPAPAIIIPGQDQQPPSQQPGYSQLGQPQKAYPQQISPVQAYPQYAYPQQGYSQQAYPQQAYPAQAYPQKGSLEQKALP